LDSPNEKQDFYAQMAQRIARRYRANKGKTLRDVYRLDADFLNTETDVDFAIHNREKIISLLANQEQVERLVDLFTNLTISFTYASNQFIQINALEETALRRIYTNYLREMERMLVQNKSDAAIATALQKLVAGHFQDLRENITRFFDQETGAEAQTNVILQKVVCAEYSPELQLEILATQLEALEQPVLDFGCGKSGLLVRYLNQRGIQAAGIDRVVEPDTALVQADWLEYHLEPQRWGTVISHMAFTNHFIFHHLYQHGSIEPYARQYMAILGSLKIGGSFFYTPGLPFIEPYLPPDKYRITRKNVIGKETVYASRILRLK
jgi:hypothetical protein